MADPSRSQPPLRGPVATAATVPPEIVPPLMHPGMYLYDPQVKLMAEYQHNCVKTALLSGVVGFGMGGVMGLFMSSMRYDTPFHTPTPENTPGFVGAPTSATSTTGSSTTTTTTATPTTTSATTQTPTTTIRSAVAGPSLTTTASSTTTTVSAAATTNATSPAAATLASSSSTPTITTAASSTIPPTTTTTATTATAASSTPAAFKPPEATTMAQVRAGFRDMGKQSYSMARNFGKIGLLFSGVECGIEGMRGRNDATNGIAAGCLTGGVLARNAGPYAVATGCAGFAVFSAAVEAYLRSDSGEE